jgi:SPP1 family predicted phage head-tail adaptor
MNPGDLRYLIQIVRPVRRKNEQTGAYEKEEVPVCQVRAAVKGVKGSEGVTAGAEQYTETIQFTIRWRADLSGGMAILWRNKRYEIERIEPVPTDGVYRRIYGVARQGVKT